MSSSPPIVLSIAGSDCCAGAGIQTDLKAIHAHGGYALTALSAVVSEVPGQVEAIEAVSDETFASQIQLLLEHYPVAAIKTGMLHSASKVALLASELARHDNPPPLVVDPVLVATSGDSLAQSNLSETLREKLFPYATLVTPNLDELEALSGRPVRNLAEMEMAAQELATQYACAILGKGGHLPEGEQVTDLLVLPNGQLQRFQVSREPIVFPYGTHGTGCTLAASIATHLAHGRPLDLACARGQAYIASAIREGLKLGPFGALNCFPGQA